MENLSYVQFDPEWGLQSTPALPHQPVYSILTEGARTWPDKTALICYDYSISYAELNILSDKLAQALKEEFDLKKGDRVATMMPNCIQHTITFFAILKIGAIGTPINVMYTPREIAYQINDAEVNTIIAINAFYPAIAEARNETNLKNIVLANLANFTNSKTKLPNIFISDNKSYHGTYDFDQLLSKYQGDIEYAKIDVDRDLGLILYTAGTTGQSKGVMIAHRSFWANNQIRYIYGFMKNDINLQIMPMFHCSGFCLVQLPILTVGGTVVLVPLFNSKECIKWITDYDISTIFAPPTFFTALINEPEFSRSKHPSLPLRITLSCGGPLTEPTRLKWKEITGLDLLNGYGMTETMCGGVGILSCHHKYKPGAIGSALNGEVKIVDEDGKTVPIGTIGEIMLRGDGLASGYWKRPQLTQEAFTRDGWLHSGDAAWMDEERFIFFSDRYKDLIVASGYNVAPVEVESVLMGHEAVQEAGVIGVPDEYRGETVKAFVSLTKNGKDAADKESLKQDILEYCKKRLATFKVPRYLEFIDEIPKNAVGKIQRRLLRATEAKNGKKAI